MADYARLKTEFQTDPVAVGYGTWATTADDLRVQGLLHDPTKRPRVSVTVPSFQIVNSFNPAEFAALTALQQAQLTTVLSAGSVDLANANVRTLLSAVFPSAGPTRTALAALWTAQQQTQSRSQEIGLGGTVADVTWARTH